MAFTAAAAEDVEVAGEAAEAKGVVLEAVLLVATRELDVALVVAVTPMVVMTDG